MNVRERDLAGLLGELLVLVGGQRLLGDDRLAAPVERTPSPVPSGSRRLCSASESGASSSQNVARTGSRPPLMPNRRHTGATLRSAAKRSRAISRSWPNLVDSNTRKARLVMRYPAHRFHPASAGHPGRPDHRRRRRHRDRRRRGRKRPDPAPRVARAGSPPGRHRAGGHRHHGPDQVHQQPDRLDGPPGTQRPAPSGASGRLWVATTGHRMRLELQGQNGDAQVVVDNGSFSIYDPTSNTRLQGHAPQLARHEHSEQGERARSRPWPRSRPS